MKTLFQSPLTPDEQYWAGFVHADGCIRKSGQKQMSLAQADPEVLRRFLAFLGQDSKITTKRQSPSGFGTKDQYSVSTSKGIDELRALGIKGTPVPELYMSRHFWRGLVDGDGSVYYDSKGYPTVVLCSGQPGDVDTFSAYIGRLFGYAGPKVSPGVRGGWYAKVGGGKARALALYLYEDGYSALPRKRDVALAFRDNSPKTNTALLSPEVTS